MLRNELVRVRNRVRYLQGQLVDHVEKQCMIKSMGAQNIFKRGIKDVRKEILGLLVSVDCKSLDEVNSRLRAIDVQ